MALPSSGPLSINDIRNALGSTSGSLRTLSALAGFTSPDSISEFYGYSSAVIFLASGDYRSFPSPQSIVKSTNIGTSWSTLSGSPGIAIWYDIAVSNNALNIIGVSPNGSAYYSTNGGTSFGEQFLSPDISSCFLSDSGTYMYALEILTGSEKLYMSSNSGTTFTVVLTNSTASSYYTAGGCAGNGEIVLVYKYFSSGGTQQFYNGSHGTGTWEASNPSVMSDKQIVATALSSTGQYILCATTSGHLLVNNNGAAYNAWTSIAKTHYMFSCDVSYSGQYMIAGSDNGYVFTSVDYGVTFTTTNIGGYNMKVGVSTSGLFAVIGGSGTNDVYTSTNGTSWTAQTNTPNLTNAQYTCLAVS